MTDNSGDWKSITLHSNRPSSHNGKVLKLGLTSRDLQRLLYNTMQHSFSLVKRKTSG